MLNLSDKILTMPLENVVHATIEFRNIQERIRVLHLAFLSRTLYSVHKYMKIA